jgi:hypothetical protein
MSDYLTGFTKLSTALTNVDAVERTFLKPTSAGGRVRAAVFDFESTAATTVGSTIGLVRLPKGAKILNIFMGWEAMSSGGGTADVDVGLYTLDGTAINATLFATNENVDSAGTKLYYGVDATVGSDFYVTQVECILTLVVGGESLAADKYMKGYVLYVENS